jgi:hypothetical protein
MRGLEPPRSFPHTDLNRARLPVPPHPQCGGQSSTGCERSIADSCVPLDLVRRTATVPCMLIAAARIRVATGALPVLARVAAAGVEPPQDAISVGT